MSNPPDGTPPQGVNGKQSAKIDPWEARERERQRYTRSGGSHRSSPSRRSSATEEDIWTETDVSLRENYLVAGLLLCVGLLIASGIPRIEENARYVLLQAGTFLVLLLLGTCRTFQENLLPALRRAPNPLLLLLVAWAGFSFLASPYRNFAATEFLRVVSGIGVYFLAGYAMKSPRQVSVATAGMLGIGVILSLFDFAEAGKHGGHQVLNNEFSILGTHEHIGSVLTLLFPVALIFALHPRIEEKRRLAATAVTLVLGGALLVSRSRSGWLATLIALVVLVIIYLRYMRPREEADSGPGRRSRWQEMIASPMVQVVAALVIFMALTSLAPLVSRRALNLRLLDDKAFTGRFLMWNGARLMIAEKPITGWGLGAFPVVQGQYTHIGDDRALVLTKGTSHDNNAHSYYLQWASETGAIGLFLHLAVVTSFLAMCFHGLPRLRTPFQLALVAGTMAAVIASMVDSLSSPMYHFAGIWAILYTWMGVGMAGLRPVARPGATGPSPGEVMAMPPSPPTVWSTSILFSLMAAGGMLVWVQVTMQAGKQAPRGTLQLVATPVGPVVPGAPIAWTSIYTDAKGVVLPTMPGTVWYMDIKPTPADPIQQELYDLHEGSKFDDPVDTVDLTRPRQSIFRVYVPQSTQPNATVTVKATYRDEYGRIYEAQSFKSVAAPKE